MNSPLFKLYRDIFNTLECDNGNHYFIRYNDSNLICKKCGRFAKIGYLQKEKNYDHI